MTDLRVLVVEDEPVMRARLRDMLYRAGATRVVEAEDAASARAAFEASEYHIVLLDLGLPDDLRLPALLFFNLGVEIGQLLFVGFLLIFTFFLLRSSRWISINLIFLEKATIYFLGGLSAYWTIDRLLSW
mgnify:CR=1 FL=1